MSDRGYAKRNCNDFPFFFFFHFYAQYDEKFNSRFKDDETIIKWSIKLDERVAGEKGLKSFPV